MTIPSSGRPRLWSGNPVRRTAGILALLRVAKILLEGHHACQVRIRNGPNPRPGVRTISASYNQLYAQLEQAAHGAGADGMRASGGRNPVAHHSPYQRSA